MTNEERLEVLENLRHALQRFRSMAIEETDFIDDDNRDMALVDLFPWVFGPRCILPAVQMCLDRGAVTGMEFYNFMYILHEFSPAVLAATDAVFPTPNAAMAGWQ